MFYLRVYIWMTQNTEREAESGRGDEYRWFLCMLGLGKMWGGAEWCLPFKCPSSVQPVRKDRQCQWQLVTETAGCLTSPCLWSTARWHLAQKKRRKVGKKRKSQTNQNSRPDTLPAPTGDQCHNDARLAHQTILSLSQCPATLSSSFHLPFFKSSPTSIKGTGGCQLKPSNLSALSFLPPQIWIWKGTHSYPVKDHHFNDIWQSFDLLGFRGRGEEIH